MIRFFRWFLLLCLISTLTGCFYWIRAYQTYLQMEEFDQNFAIIVEDEFSVLFKKPILYNEDFISLSKLQPSERVSREAGETSWRYWFRKVDEQGIVFVPEVRFYFDLDFNKEKRLTRWAFSSLFLQIAPAELLELSFRSLGSATINKETRQLKANTDSINKISIDLPRKDQILEQLGEPIKIKDRKNKETYYYHFLLETYDIEKGYEDRALTEVKITFDKKTKEMIKMGGRFAGLKISIDYRKFLKKESEHIAQMPVLLDISDD